MQRRRERGRRRENIGFGSENSSRKEKNLELFPLWAGAWALFEPFAKLVVNAVIFLSFLYLFDEASSADRCNYCFTSYIVIQAMIGQNNEIAVIAMRVGRTWVALTFLNLEHWGRFNPFRSSRNG